MVQVISNIQRKIERKKNNKKKINNNKNWFGTKRERTEMK